MEETVEAATASNEFFGGSNALLPLAEATGLSIDKLNFLVCQFVGLLLGIPYRTIWGPHRTPLYVRHLIQIVVGTAMALFCFGTQVKHLFIQAGISYLMMKYIRSKGLMERCILIYCMFYLCVCHIYRMYYDYGGYTLDITGPLMVSTQRLTSLAFNLADGRAKKKDPTTKLSPTLLKYAVDSLPSPLEFSSYILTFNGMMCGPFCLYTDYSAFIDGSNYNRPAINGAGAGEAKDDVKLLLAPRRASGFKSLSHGHQAFDVFVDWRGENCLATFTGNSGEKPALCVYVLQGSGDGVKHPNPTMFVLKTLAVTAACGAVTQILVPMFSIYYILDPVFKSHNILYRLLYIVISTTLLRPQYYFAWKLADAVNGNSGMGFYYDDKGREQWNLIENADIYQVEMSLSLKTLLDNWNKMTTLWLRLVVYERYHNSLLVFLFSAAWHGFYAGYYLTFIFGGVFVYAGRLIRRNIQPLFQNSTSMSRLYDGMTFLATRLSIAYLVVPFLLLEFWKSVYVYWDLYFLLHIIVIVLALVLQFKPWKLATSKKSQKD